ncbi:MAG: hypothetical protein IKR85_06610 [Clostridia bacterium]|nr:hypothetical protein [Clostridia bacterium]
MAVYRYCYGALPEKGIGVIACSPQITQLEGELNQLSSLYAVFPGHADGEKLMYHLKIKEQHVLGVSLIDPPKAGGYSRSSPLGVQYVFGAGEEESFGRDLPDIVNFATFNKLSEGDDAPVDAIPRLDKGYSFRMPDAVRAAFADGLIRCALADDDALLLAVLPPDKNGQYAAARYYLSDALSFVPASLRSRLTFMTGIPAMYASTGGSTLDYITRYSPRVVCCTPDKAEEISRYRRALTVNTQTGETNYSVGAFARHMVKDIQRASALAALDGLGISSVKYEETEGLLEEYLSSRNNAEDELLAAEDALETLRRKNDALREQLDREHKDSLKLRRECDELEDKLERAKYAEKELKAKLDYQKSADRKEERAGAYAARGRSKTDILGLVIIIALALSLAANVFLGIKAIKNGKAAKESVGTSAEFTPEPTADATPDPSADATTEPSAEPTPDPSAEATTEPTATPEQTKDDAGTNGESVPRNTSPELISNPETYDGAVTELQDATPSEIPQTEDSENPAGAAEAGEAASSGTAPETSETDAQMSGSGADGSSAAE